MKKLIGDPFDVWRMRDMKIIEYYGGVGDETCGAFLIKRKPRDLFVIASTGEMWDHVSVSISNDPQNTPTWKEMVFVKQAFFGEDDWAVEFHPPVGPGYVNDHPGTLHLWRHQSIAFPAPPLWLV